MDNLLMLFDEDSQNRYKTVLENIKNASNSFYDSYNSLLEHFLRTICPNNVKGSITNIIKDEENAIFILEVVGFNQKFYNKLLDYALKLNKHKHNKEKDVDIDSVLNYMKLFYDVVYTYAKYVKYTIPSFDEDYFIDIYNQFHEDKEDIKSVKDKVDLLIREKEKERTNSIIKNARIEAFHCGNYSYESSLSDEEYNSQKTILIILMISGFMLFTIAIFLIKDRDLALGFMIIFAPFWIFYLVRLIQLIKCGKSEKVDSLGTSKYLIVKLSDDYVPLNLRTFKFSQHFINFLAGLLLLGSIFAENNILLNVVLGILFILFIVTCILFIEHKKTFDVLIMHSRFGDMYYSYKYGEIVDKIEDGTFIKLK